MSNLQNLKRAVDQLKGTKIGLQLDAAQIRTQIRQVEREIERLRDLRVSGNFTDDMQEDLEALQRRLGELRRQLKDVNSDIQFDTAVIRAGTHDLREMEEQAKRVSDAFNAIASAMDSVASGIGGLNRFADSITGAFGQMANIFSADLATTAIQHLTEMMTENLVGSFRSAISRYDILNTFAPYMQLTGVSAASANAALSRVNESILGLPIGLDEAAQRLRRYQMFMGDLDRATNLTIGVQRALFAGGAPERFRYQAFMMIDRLLSSGSLNNVKQWNSLIQGLGVSMRYVAQEMGIAYEDVGQLANGLMDGTIATESFLDALVSLGEGTSEAAKGLDDALSIYKTTIESWMQNIHFAFTRGTANLMNAVNASLESVSGTDITGYLSRIRGAINDFYASGVDVVGDDERVSRFVGAVERLIDAFGRFDGQLLAGGIIDNLARVIDMFAQALRRLPVGETEKFVAFATTLAGPIAKLFARMASGLPVLLGVFQRFKDFDFESLLDKIITQAELLARAVAGLLSIIPDGLMGDIMAFALVWGRPLVSVITALSGAFRALGAALSTVALSGTVGEAFGSGGLLAGLLKLASAHPYITAAVAVIGGIAHGIKLIGDAQEDAAKAVEQRRLAGLSAFDMSPIAASINATAKGIADARASFESELEGLDGTTEKTKELTTKILEIEKDLESAEGGDRERLIAQRSVYIQQLSELSDAFIMTLNIENQALDDNSLTQLKNADAIVEAVKKREAAKLYEGRLGEIAREEIDAENRLERIKEIREGIEEERAMIEARRFNLYRSAPSNWRDAYEGRVSYRTAGLSGKIAPRAFSEWQIQMADYDAQLETLDGRLWKLNLPTLALTALMSSLGAETEQIIAVFEELGLVSSETGESMEGGFDGVSEKLQEIQEQYKKLRDEIAETLKSIATGFDQFERPKTQKAATTIGNLTTRKEFAEQLNEDLGLVIEAVMSNPDWIPDANTRADFLEALIGSPEENAGIINGIAENIRLGKPEWAEKVAGAYTDSVTAAAAATNTEEFGIAFAQALRHGVESINWSDYETLTEDQINEIIMRVTGLDNLSPEKLEEKVKEKLSPGKGKGIWGIGLPLFEGDGKDDQTGLTAFAEETIPNAVEKIGGLAEAVDKLQKDHFDKLIRTEGDVIDETEDLADAISDLASAIEARFGTLDNFISLLDRVGDEANSAAGQVYRLRDAILELEDKEITLTVNQNVHENVVGGTVRGNPNAPIVAKLATGGAAGTDTIPAWLSPGEFVLRKGAVDKLGNTFLSRLNSLDIRGAIDSMMHRYYAAPSTPTMASYTNNSYDNRKVTVNQTVHTRNPHFANRRITNRFAYAL